jgi:hypothetical protein
MGSELDILENTEGTLFTILLKGKKISLSQNLQRKSGLVYPIEREPIG